MSIAPMAMASPDDRPGHGLESGDKSLTPNAQHTRTYQACIPCRRRKVRCDLGPVDNPHDPPCVRCRREAKECYFSATRRKKRAADSGAGPEDVEADDYEVRGGRKRLKGGPNDAGSDYGSIDATAVAASHSPVYMAQPLTPGGSLGRRQPLRRPDHSQSAFGDSENEEKVNNHTAAILQTAELHHGHDALNVLLAAAQQDTKQSAAYDQYNPATGSPVTIQNASPEMRSKPQHKPSTLSIDPLIMPLDDMANESALRAWSRFRFVRNGWFTAQEGMKYIEYFYTYLSPLTPIALPDYRHPSRHVALLENEPLLAVVILMISSRYTLLSGVVGRSYALHQRLWNYTQSMIGRVLWGMELPGVYTSSLGGNAGCDVNPLSRKGLLTLGTVESLMILTEWHSRHVHFPADEDDAELMAPDHANGDPAAARGNGAKPVSSWIEPCFRSDRMCWKLLNMAKSVAMEIGVFDKDSSRHTKDMTREHAAIYEQRRLHVKSVLLVYITQTSGRLGVAAMLPEGYAVPDHSELFLPTRELLKDIRDVVLHFWLQLARLVKMGNEKLYANRHHTRDIIRTGRYKTLLQHVNPLLTKWRNDVDHYHKDIPPQMYHIMMIEYEHSRVCVNQLALQAVVERCIDNNAVESESGSAIPPDRLNQWYGDDRENVGAVIDACRNVLKIIVDGLAPGGFLKHAPVRTSFRMISVAMVLVKTFAFGANAKEMSVSLNLMHRTVTALRECVVDDSHIANGFAHHMALLVERVPKALKRFPGSGQGNSRGASASRGVSQSPAPQSLYASQMADNGRPLAGSSETQWGYGGVGVQGNGLQHDDRNNDRPHPLDGYDFGDSGDAFMLMPPPANPTQSAMGDASMGAGEYGPYGGYSSNGFGFGNDGFGDQGWVALPLDNIFGGQNVQQTGFGPTIDGDDMLEVLLRGNIGT